MEMNSPSFLPAAFHSCCFCTHLYFPCTHTTISCLSCACHILCSLPHTHTHTTTCLHTHYSTVPPAFFFSLSHTHHAHHMPPSFSPTFATCITTAFLTPHTCHPTHTLLLHTCTPHLTIPLPVTSANDALFLSPAIGTAIL